MRGAKYAVLSLLVIAACTPAPPAAVNSPEIAARDKDWESAFNAGDAARVLAVYTDDARLLPPNGPMAQGRAGLEPVVAAMVSSGVKATLSPLESMAAGNTGYSLGTYEMKDAQGAVVDRGKYMELLRKVDGQWRISNDIWNSDLPAAAPGKNQIIITHAVADDAKWLAAWADQNGPRKLFAQNGAPSVRIFTGTEFSNQHALLVDVTDLAAFTAWSNTPETAALKAEHGVIEEGFTIYQPME